MRLSRARTSAALGYLAAALAGCILQPRPQPIPLPSPPAAQPRGLLVVGASYTLGVGASTPSGGLGYRIGHLLGEPTEVAGAPGIGYLNPGPHHKGTFAQHIAGLQPRFRPDVVLIQGGRDDVGSAGNRLAPAVEATITLARDRFPPATVTLLGPIPGHLPVSPRLRTIETELSIAARHQHVRFIDPIAEQWITPANLTRYSGRVPGHPNDAGYGYLAARVAAELRDRSETGQS